MDLQQQAQSAIDEAGRILASGNPKQEDILKAADMIENIMSYDRENPGLDFMMACVYMRMNRWALAEKWMRMVLKAKPDFVEALNNLGFILENLGERKEAMRCFRRAQKLRPDDPALINNIATAKVNNGTPDEAIELCTKAIEIDPDFADGHWNRGLACLEKGMWEEGFKEYRWGLNLSGTSSQSRKVRHYPGEVPWWEGTAGKSVVVYSEQGVGDEILAASMLREAIDDADITFESHPRLVDIMRHSFPDIPIYGTRKMNWKKLHFPKWTKIDSKCAIFTLGEFYRKKDEDFPRVPYLKPYEDKVEEFKDKLSKYDKPKIGIAWQGGSVTTRVDLRSIPLGLWTPMFRAVDAEWISLQYDPADKVGMWEPIVQSFNKDMHLNLHHWTEDINDLDTCYGGLMHALDLIICVNTSIVHAAGAYGVECWTLTPSRPAWRYGVKGEHVPWYGPWVKQYRQTGDSWVSTLKQVQKDLEARCS